jgi:HSP20 family protein
VAFLKILPKIRLSISNPKIILSQSPKTGYISAETKQEEKKEEKGYIYRERRSGSYYRAIYLPSPVDPDNSKATYENGVLEIKMPKTEVKKKTRL